MDEPIFSSIFLKETDFNDRNFLNFLFFKFLQQVFRYNFDDLCNETYSPFLGDGLCDDETNDRACEFDYGDCCLPSNQSHLRCEICQCYSFNISTSTQRMTCPNGYELNIEENTCREIDECQEYNDTCGDLLCKNTDGSFKCFTKAVVYYSPKKGKDDFFGSVRLRYYCHN